MRDRLLAHVTGDHTIETLMDVPAKCQVVRQDVEHADHLREDEDAVAVAAKTREKLVEKNHLAAVHDETLENLVL